MMHRQRLPMLTLTIRITIALTVGLLLLILVASWVGESVEARELAYLSESIPNPDQEQVRLMDIGRGLTVAVTRTFSDIPTRLQWTPDGESLIFAANSGRSTDIYHLNLETRSLTRLTTFDDNNQSRIIEIALSSDAEQIGFLHVEGARIQNQLYVMNVDGSDMRQMTQDQGSIYSSLSWSPEDQRLLYIASTQTSRVPELWLLDLRDTEPEFTRLLGEADGMGVLSARWTSDGTQVDLLGVPIPNEDNLPQPYLSLDIATGAIKQILEDGAITRKADWSQDDTRLVYPVTISASSGQPGPESIVLLDVASGESRLVFEMSTATAISDIQWSDDETLLAVTAVGARGPSAYVLVIRLADGQIMQSTNRTDRITGVERGPAWRP